jgi:patatin-like phospholipase/acyl hydrolase
MKILSLNGGGMLGYIPLCILENLEKETGKPSCEIFDLIGGVSTGSIIGGALSKGIPASEVKEKYKQLREKIFKNKRSFFMSLFFPLYKIKNLENTLKDIIGDLRINELKTRYMTYALRIDGSFMDSVYWKSWKDDVKLYEVMCASSSAPHYFQPYQVEDHWYVDGGVVNNNPSLALLSEAIKFGERREDIKIVNLWAEHLVGIKDPAKHYGLLTILPGLPTMFTTGGEDSTDYYVNQMIGDNLISLRPAPNLPIDTGEFEIMERIANELWEENKDRLLDLVK